MNVFRALLLPALLLFSSGAARALPAPSARKICQVELGFIEEVSASRDGRFLAILSVPGERGSDCYVFERRTHRLTSVPGSSRMEPLLFSRDGRSLWVWGLHLDEPLPGLSLKPGDFPFIAQYDLRSRRFVRSLSGATASDSVPSAAALSRDGRTLIYATQDGWIWGFSTRTGRALWKRRAQNRGDEPASIILNSDGSAFMRIEDEDGAAQQAEIVSARTGRVLASLRQKFASPSEMRSAYEDGAFAPIGHQAAVFQPDTQQWVFFDVRTQRAQWKMGGAGRSSEGDLKWQWSPDGRFVGVSGPKGFEMRDARTGRVLQLCPAFKEANVAFSADGRTLYVLSQNDSGFGAGTAVWQWRLFPFPTPEQRRSDESFMSRLRGREERFALSPRHINESLTMAARRADAKRVRLLLGRGASVDATDGRGETALQNAVNANAKAPDSLATVNLLLQRGANVNVRGGAILAGAAAKNFALTELLLRHGARVNEDASAYGTPTALHAAVSFGQLDSVRLLLEHGADASAHGKDGVTPLIELANSSFTVSPANEAAIARLLIEHGANVNARTSEAPALLMPVRQTALITAAWNTKDALVNVLLEHGADANARNQRGETALTTVAMWDATRVEDFEEKEYEQRETAIIKALLAHGVTQDQVQKAFDLVTHPFAKALLRSAPSKAPN